MKWDLNKLEQVVTLSFSGDANSVHGPTHWRRVERNGLWLASRSGADPIIVRLFAWFHDSMRISDGTDHGHGQRGADYAEELRGTLFELSDADFEKLYYACTWHTDEHFTEDPTIGTCWDADRLDLGRVGIQPSPKFLNTSAAKAVAAAGTFSPFLKEEEIAAFGQVYL